MYSATRARGCYLEYGTVLYIYVERPIDRVPGLNSGLPNFPYLSVGCDRFVAGGAVQATVGDGR